LTQRYPHSDALIHSGGPLNPQPWIMAAKKTWAVTVQYGKPHVYVLNHFNTVHECDRQIKMQWQ